MVVSLPVGGVAVLSDRAAIGCAELAAADGGVGKFLVVAANADTAPDNKPDFVLADSSVSITFANVTGQRSGALTQRGAGPELSSAMAQLEAGASVSAEARLRAMERRVLRLGDRRSLRGAAQLQRSTGVLGQVSAQSTPTTGDTLSYKVPDAKSDNACEDFTQVRAVVKAVGQHGILVQDVNSPAGGFSSADFTAIADEFDKVIYTADTVHFGSPLDIDNNGHVVLLYTPIVNAITERGSGSVTEGFFFGGDLFPVSQCKQSNGAEIFYLIVPDPDAKFSDKREAASVRENTRGTIAHEFQHMINLSVRIRNDVPDETTWLNEGLSHFAEELVGRKVRGFNDTQELAIADVADQLNGLKDFNAFFGQNLVRFRNWLRAPGDIGATSEHADTSLAVRGASWALLRWSADQYAKGNVAAFTRALVAGPESGVRNLTARAGVAFDSLMAGWMVANFADNNGITGINDRYTYISWNIRNVETAVNQGDGFPLVVTSLAQDQSLNGTAPSAGGSYFQLTTSSGSRTIIGQLDSAGGAATYTGARLYILRIE
ncbi:MAG TPA: hypothetical protein VIQ74_05730 [Gemmatimonadaceae bacterium]